MKDMIYSLYSQGWYIGITAASQAVKAGSTPVPCSKCESTPSGVLFAFYMAFVNCLTNRSNGIQQAELMDAAFADSRLQYAILKDCGSLSSCLRPE